MDFGRINPDGPVSDATLVRIYINLALQSEYTSAERLAESGWTATLEYFATATRRLPPGAGRKTDDVYVIFTAPDGSDQEIATVPAGHEASARQWVTNYNRTVRPL